jgi:DNA-binding beta-propeller fold protein YncE
MKGFVVLCVLILASCLLLASPFYVVLNEMGETLSTGLLGGELRNNVATTGSIPNQILSYDGKLYVVCSGSSRIEEFSVTEESARLLRSFSLPAGSNPYLMCIYNGNIYTSLLVSNKVAKINLESGAVTLSPVTGNGPQGVYADRDYLMLVFPLMSDNMDFETGRLIRTSP